MRNFSWIAALALVALLLSQPAAAALGAAEAMAQWWASVAPSVFPFLALMPLLTGEAAVHAYEGLLGGLMERLFALPGSAAPAIAIGMIAGSPAGSAAARRIASASGMNRGQLQRIVASVSGLSPAFLLGGVGAGMLGSAAMGRMLVRSQLMAQLALLLLLRRAWRDRAESVPPREDAAAESPVRGAVLTTLTICGWMALFGALAFAARAVIGSAAANALLCLMDLPSGARLVSAMAMDSDAKLILLAAMCGFGGACVGVQNLSALKDCGMRAAEFFTLRLLAAAISAGGMLLQLRLPAALAARRLPDPLAVSALAAAMLSVPILLRLRKSIS